MQHGAKLPEILLPFLGDLLKEAERRIHISFVSVMNSRITSGEVKDQLLSVPEFKTDYRLLWYISLRVGVCLCVRDLKFTDGMKI